MITITTKLHSGLTRSLAGKEFRTEFNTGPRNLIKASRAYHSDRLDAVRSYGNIGAGYTWMEIDGVQIPWMHFPKSIEEAKWLINASRTGEFQQMLEDIDRAEEQRYQAELDKEDLERGGWE